MKLPCTRGKTVIASVLTAVSFFAGGTGATTLTSSIDTTQEAAQLQDIQKQQALFALELLVSEAKGYDDCLLRARVRLQAADLLWPLSSEKARELVDLVFDDTRNKDLNEQERYSIRTELLDVVRKNDPKLLAALIKRLNDDREESRASLTRESTERITAQGALHLDLARDMLREGNQERAAEMARRSLSEGRSPRFLLFMDDLRKRDELAANKLFLDSLRVVLKESTDPNDVLYLGLYLFSPGEVSFTDNNGQLIIGYGLNFSARKRPTDSLLEPYLTAAVNVMERALAPGRDLADQSDAARFALQQLVPLFEQYLPYQAQWLRSRLTQLGPVALAQDKSRHGNASISPEGLSVSEISKEVERTAGTRQRDSLYFDVAVAALGRGELEKSEELRSKIIEVDLRQQLLDLIAFTGAWKAIERGELDEAERTATNKLSAGWRAIIYQKLAAAWLKRADLDRAMEMISSSSLVTQKIEQRPHRASVYIALASLISARDPSGAFEFVEAAAKDINSADKFDVRRDSITFLISKPNGSKYEQRFPLGATLLSVIPELANVDLMRCLYLARSLRGPESRAATIIAACRGVLRAAKTQRQIKEGKPAGPGESPVTRGTYE